jgi:hypothetical protein
MTGLQHMWFSWRSLELLWGQQLMQLLWVGAVCSQAFINTAREIYKKITDGVFDVSNEVRRGASWQRGLQGLHMTPRV